MIDWFNLIANASWIIGCSILLAVLSYAAWQASENKQQIRWLLIQAGYQKALSSAGLLICLGLAGTTTKLWECLLWLLFAAIFAYKTVGFIRRSEK